MQNNQFFSSGGGFAANSRYGTRNYHSNSNNNHNHNAGGNAAHLTNKLYDSIAALQRERDDLQRKSNLGEERLRLVTEEKQNIEKSVHDLRDKLAVLNKQAKSGQAEAELTELKDKAEILEHKAQFQHNELINKQDKLLALQKSMKLDAASRQQAVQTGNEKLCQLRNLLGQQQRSSSNAKMAAKTKLELLKVEMDGFNSDRLWKDWPRIVEQKAAAVQEESMQIQRSIEEMAIIVNSYKNDFGAVEGGLGMAPPPPHPQHGADFMGGH